MTVRTLRRLVPALLLLPTLGGCAQIGAGMGIIAQAIPRDVEAAYKGLAGQQVVIMVWADPQVRLDRPDLQENVAAAVQDKLISVQLAEKPDDLKGTTFPVATSAMVRYQEDHPEIEYQPATDVAAKFNGSRLIYVQVTDFATRSDASLELYKGTLSAHLSVVEMRQTGPDHVATKMVYDGGTISITYPKKSINTDGEPGGTDDAIGQKTVQTFAEDVAKRFYKHEEERT